MNRFMTVIDISDNLTRGLAAIRTIPNGIPSLVTMLIFLALEIILWPWVWYLDLDATRDFGEKAAAVVANSGFPMFDPAMAGWALAGSLFAFTLIEMGGPILSRHGMALASGLVFTALAVDAYTDAPRVSEIMEPTRATFIAEMGGFFGNALFLLARAGMLFMATCGLELFFAVLAVLCLALFLKGFSKREG